MEWNIFTSQIPFLVPNQYGMCAMMTAIVNAMCFYFIFFICYFVMFVSL